MSAARNASQRQAGREPRPRRSGAGQAGPPTTASRTRRPTVTTPCSRSVTPATGARGHVRVRGVRQCRSAADPLPRFGYSSVIRGWGLTRAVYGYVLILRDEVVYVGITTSPRRRAQQHRQDGKVGELRVLVRFRSRVEARVWERNKLIAFRHKYGRLPRYNRTPTGGRRW